jgi:hypothetical protein
MRSPELSHCVFTAVEQQPGAAETEVDGGGAAVLGGLRGAGAQERHLRQLTTSLQHSASNARPLILQTVPCMHL